MATAILFPPRRPLLCCSERGRGERKRERAGHEREGEREKRGFGLVLGRALVFFDYCYFYWQNQQEPLRRREFAFWVVT